MKVFGDVDKTKEGKVKSEYPSWYYEQQKDELEESIRHKQSMLDQDLVPGTEKALMRSRLKQESDKLSQIEESKPRFTEKELDEIAKMVKTGTGNANGTLSFKISEMMFKRSDEEKGIADAHEEARRISTPCIKLEPHEIEFVKACEVPISNDGKVTRGGAEKAWKIGRKIIGENSNTEILRRN